MRSALVLSLAIAGTLVAAPSFAACYTCTPTKPHVCVPTTGQGWEECYDGGRYPCAVNALTECYGSESVDMLATRSLLIARDAAAPATGGPVRILKGRGGKLDPATVQAILGSDENTLLGSGFALGDAVGPRPVGAWSGHGLSLEARDSFQGALFTLAGNGESRDVRLHEGDLALIDVMVEGRPATLVVTLDRFAPDEPELIARLTDIQVDFRAQVDRWNGQTSLVAAD